MRFLPWRAMLIPLWLWAVSVTFCCCFLICTGLWMGTLPARGPGRNAHGPRSWLLHGSGTSAHATAITERTASTASSTYKKCRSQCCELKQAGASKYNKEYISSAGRRSHPYSHQWIQSISICGRCCTSIRGQASVKKQLCALVIMNQCDHNKFEAPQGGICDIAQTATSDDCGKLHKVRWFFYPLKIIFL